MMIAAAEPLPPAAATDWGTADGGSVAAFLPLIGLNFDNAPEDGGGGDRGSSLVGHIACAATDRKRRQAADQRDREELRPDHIDACTTIED
jgi:hypothetical protein